MTNWAVELEKKPQGPWIPHRWGGLAHVRSRKPDFCGCKTWKVTLVKPWDERREQAAEKTYLITEFNNCFYESLWARPVITGMAGTGSLEQLI